MTEKKIKKFLLSLAQEWAPLFGLEDWDIQYEWFEGSIPNQHTDAEAVTTANWAYKWATIQVSLLNCRDSKAKLERMFFHECGHILVRVMNVPGDEDGHAGASEERFCTDFAQMIQRVGKHCYEKGQREGKAEAIGEQPRDYEPSDIGVQVAVA